jgi:membrane protein implicated in regulation of membrane protease activity
MIFGFTGLSLNAIWKGVFGSINILVLISGAVALVTSLTLTSLLARVLGRFMPQTESHGEKLNDFINREAEVRYTVTAKSGTVILYDKFSNVQTLNVRRDKSCVTDILPKTKVVILSYSTQDGEFIVIPADQIIK